MTLEELKYKRKGAIILVCTLGLAGLSKVGGFSGIWRANIFKGTSFDQGGIGLVVAGISFCLLTVLLAVPMFIIGVMQLIYYSILISQRKRQGSPPQSIVQPITFVASHISSDNNLIYPDKIAIYPNKIEIFKGYISGYRKTAIAQSSVCSVSINKGILFSNIMIETSGSRISVVEGFNENEAKRIVQLINPY